MVLHSVQPGNSVAPITPMNRGLKVLLRPGIRAGMPVAPITPMNRGLKVYAGIEYEAGGD